MVYMYDSELERSNTKRSQWVTYGDRVEHLHRGGNDPSKVPGEERTTRRWITDSGREKTERRVIVDMKEENKELIGHNPRWETRSKFLKG